MVPLTTRRVRTSSKSQLALAGQALRVLGVAVGEDRRRSARRARSGLAGLPAANPIRPSVVPALQQLRRAGIRIVMMPAIRAQPPLPLPATTI
jgi:magnesium-transporting ATPase (P-type)